MYIETRYYCPKCGLEFPSGQGGYLYIEVDIKHVENRVKILEEEIRFLHRYLDVINDFQDRLNSEERRFIEADTETIYKSLMNKLEDLKLEIKLKIDEIELNLIDMLEQIDYAKIVGLEVIRIKFPIYNEGRFIETYLGEASPESLIKKIGFNSYCICLDCLHQFEADLRDENNNPFRRWLRGKPAKDERICPKCGSRNIITAHEITSKRCPRCRVGKIEREIMGCIA